MTMNNLIIQIMVSISEVMETMFYIPVEPRDGYTTAGISDLAKSGRVESATITFHGLFSGTIDLIVPESLLIIMAENFMGESRQNLTEEHLKGTLQEALNMVAGNTFSKIDSKSSFCLGVPEINTDAARDISGGNTEPCFNTSLLLVDTLDGPMGIKVHVK